VEDVTAKSVDALLTVLTQQLVLVSTKADSDFFQLYSGDFKVTGGGMVIW